MLADVAVQTQKQDIIQWLNTVDDEKVIRQFSALKNNLTNQDLVKLTTLETQLATQGIEDMQAGRVVPHDDVRKVYAKWL